MFKNPQISPSVTADLQISCFRQGELKVRDDYLAKAV